jgi:hypothetical protein
MATFTVDGVEYEWDYDYDDFYAEAEREDAVVLLVRDVDTEGERFAETLGGITLASLSVSDHGNVNLSPEDEFHLASLARDLVESW